MHHAPCAIAATHRGLRPWVGAWLAGQRNPKSTAKQRLPVPRRIGPLTLAATHTHLLVSAMYATQSVWHVAHLPSATDHTCIAERL